MNRYKKQMPIDRYEDMELRLQGWDFDMERLKETERGRGGVSLSPPKVPRAKLMNSPTLSYYLTSIKDN